MSRFGFYVRVVASMALLGGGAYLAVRLGWLACEWLGASAAGAAAC